MNDDTLLLILIVGLMVASGMLIIWYGVYTTYLEPRIRQKVSDRLGKNIVRRRHMNGYHWQIEEPAPCLLSVGVLLLNMLADIVVVFMPIILIYGVLVAIVLSLGRS